MKMNDFGIYYSISSLLFLHESEFLFVIIKTINIQNSFIIVSSNNVQTNFKLLTKLCF